MVAQVTPFRNRRADKTIAPAVQSDAYWNSLPDILSLPTFRALPQGEAMGTVALVVLIGVVVIWVLIYNTLIRRRNRVEQAFSTIDVQLVQRYDLIPKLVETVRQYMTHERSLLEEIVRLRTAAIGSATPAERLRADNELPTALGQLRIGVTTAR